MVQQLDLKQPMARILRTYLNISGLHSFKLQNGQAKPSEIKGCKNSHKRHQALATFAVALRASLIRRHYLRTFAEAWEIVCHANVMAEKSAAFDQPPRPSSLKPWALLSKHCCGEKWQKASTWLSLAPKLLQVDSWMGSCKKVCWILLTPQHPLNSEETWRNNMPDASTFSCLLNWRMRFQRLSYLWKPGKTVKILFT